MAMTPRQIDQAWVEMDRERKLAAANARAPAVDFNDQIFVALRDSIVRPDGTVPGIATGPSLHWRNHLG